MITFNKPPRQKTGSGPENNMTIGVELKPRPVAALN